MKKRRALLIGVPEYESDAITNLPIVCRDIENLHASLEKSGFTIHSLGTDGISQTGRSKLLQALRRECKEAQGVETLLLYFSGHGMHCKGKDYLIPSDAVLDDAEYVEEYLVTTDIGDIIDQSGAETIIFFIDACREGVKLGFKNTYLVGWSKGDRRQASRRSFVMVFACGPGQVSQYVGGEDGFSLFSKALAEVLDPQHFACTLKEVLDETQARLNILIVEQGKQPQKIYYAHESAVEDNTLSQIICESVTAATGKGKASNPWSEAALQSPLWKNKGTEANLIVAQLQQQVAKILAACWQEWEAAINSFPQDQWRDEALPIRVLEALDLLVFRSDPPIELTDAETALVVTAPFVREAVLASGFTQAAKVNPLSLEGTKPETVIRSAIDKVHQSNPRLVRKAQRLQDQDRTEDRDAVMAWLLHRCLLKTLELWMPESEGGSLSSNLLKSLESVSQCSSRLSKETLKPKRLLELARCLFADVERIDRDDRPEALQSRLTVGGYSEEQQIREKMVGYLLKLAGLLAIDIRTLSDVLIDHIGLSDPLTPNDVSSTIAQARWNPSGRGRTLRVTCHHPAVDLVIREHIEQANLVLAHIFRQVEEKKDIYIPIAQVSCSLIDELIDTCLQETNTHNCLDLLNELNKIAGIWLEFERISLLTKYGLRQTVFTKEIIQLIQHNDKGILLLPGDSLLLAPQEPFFYKILLASKKMNKTIEELLRRIKQFSPKLGFKIPNIDSECIKSLTLTENDFRLLFQDPDENESWLDESDLWLKEQVSAMHLVLGAAKLNQSVATTYQQLEKFVCLGLQLPQLDLPGLEDLIPIKDDVWLLSQKLNGRSPWLKTQVSAMHLVLGAAKLNKSVAVTYQQLEKFVCLGLQLPQLDPPALEDLIPTEDDLLLLSQDLDGESPWLEAQVSAMHLVLGAAEFNQSVAATYQQLEKFVCLGLQLPQLDLPALENLIPTEDDLLLLSQDLNRRSLWLEAQVSAMHLVLGAEQLNQSVAVTYQQLEKFVCLGLQLPQLDLPALENLIPTEDDLLLLSQDLDGRRPWLEAQVSAMHLVLGAAKLNKSVAATYQRLEKFVCLGLQLPQLDLPALENLIPTEDDLLLLSQNLDGESPWLEAQVSAMHLVLGAAELNQSVEKIYIRFQAFTSLLNLKLPLVNLKLLKKWNVKIRDILILSQNLNGIKPWVEDSFSLIHVIQFSARLNEPILETLRHLLKFSALGFSVPEIDVETLGNFTPTLNDLVAVSQDLDGLAPWIEGIIPADHIVHAAKKLDEPVEGTLERLRHFTPILSLILPTGEPNSWQI
ncbi:hypothetical protein CDG76_23365 [Nostoc sp. 'Peltigera membranacea cyanobiont' 210A]|uniref:caspase family protein n=1 Tax=Nostoc sp. 'Peltigera membranacea cyanobiont' 210A TaxID=2014529 RepID=UPI000B95133F|nr:caspase family protein [Nostoc sp. 'Peltigera membranacea cyanobiont' 210A]OYD92469.1 hypothetical protein CDG76_23365 [Nostoc sp. 'Peltigera membranacea cyanobiont' 210A]